MDDGELLVSALCLKTLSDCECVGVDSSDTSGVDSSSLSTPVIGDDSVGAVPIRRSLSFDSFSMLEVGTVIMISSFNVEIERLFVVGTDDVVFRGMLFPIYLSSVDLDLNAGFGDGGGEMNSEDGLAMLMLLPVFFGGLCEQADLVLCWDAMLR